MDWDEIICIESGEYPQVYLAEIIGIHPRYRDHPKICVNLQCGVE